VAAANDSSPVRIGGLILAGGQGSRMGGLDKGLVTFRGHPMIASVIDRFAPQVHALAINANRSAAQYEAFGYPVVSDALTGYAGPLAGLAVGFAQAHSIFGHGCSHIATTPCDSPHLPTDLVAQLSAALVQERADIAVAKTESGAQPVFALYGVHLASSLDAFLATGKRKIDAWTAQHRVAHVFFEDETAFANINTEDELRRLS
jgi:molybdenum cofactor guanylyltransferase